MENEIVRVVNRRNYKKKADCYESRNRRRLNDEYLVIWKNRPPTWEKCEKLLKKDEYYKEVKMFEMNIMKTYHRTWKLGNGQKPLFITGMGHHNGTNLFVYMSLGSEEFATAPADIMYEFCQEVVIRFFEQYLTFKNKKMAVIRIPKSLQKLTAKIYNNFVTNDDDDADDNEDNDDDDADDADISSDDGCGSDSYDENDSQLVLDQHQDITAPENLWEQQIYDLYYNKKGKKKFPKDFSFRQKSISSTFFSLDEME